MDAYSYSMDSDSDDCDSMSNNLGRRVDKVLMIRDVRGKRCDSDEDDSEIEELSYSRKMYDFSSSDEENGETENSKESMRKIYELAMSLPSPENLVSAMKGSREKEGGSQRKVTVTWAPEVYDPPPTDLELILTRGTKQQKVPKKEKKSGKKAQKGKDFSSQEGGRGGSKESSGGVGRDKKKKQHRGGGGGSRRYNVFADGGDDGMESLSWSSPDSAYESNKGSSKWSSRDKKKKESRNKGGKIRRYDLPPSDSDEDEEGQHVKESGRDKKKKESRGKGGNIRRYDLPPSDSDEDENEGAGKVEAVSTDDSHCGKSILNSALKEVHCSVAKAL